MFYRILLCFVICCRLSWSADLHGPQKADSLRFAIIGDSGTGQRPAYEIGAQLARARETFPFEFVVMLGDNLYGGEKVRDFKNKFELPYKTLLDAGVKFYAALGNHDDPNQRSYKLFNMNGKKYYTFKPRNGVRFFALDSNYMDKPQLQWLENELKASGSDWKICFFHHPLYSSGDRHGPSLELRAILEPLFVKYGVNLVLSGHEHFYERIKPQRDIYYFIVGSSAKLENGIRRSDITAKGYERDRTFMLMEIAGDQLFFQTLSRTGAIVDSGVLDRPKTSGSIPRR
jgi:calcineurin-like phosphoesterase family protein